MKRLRLLNLFGIFILSTFSSSQSLTDDQVIAAINRVLSGKRHELGLTLNDVQTNLLSGLICRTCGTTGYTIFVYTPESWIELKAVQARREMLPFGLENVTPEMRLPYIHALASPSRPEYLDAHGMGMASSVHRIVLSSTDRSDVIQPLSESQAEVESNSALRSFTQSSAGAVFSIADVERLRSEDIKHEFFFVVVGDNQNKYFKVKAKFFNQLFGSNSSVYAELKSNLYEGGAMKEQSPESIYSNSSAETQPAKVSTLKTIHTASNASTYESQDKFIPAPSVAKATSSKVNLDVQQKTDIPASIKPDVSPQLGKSSEASNNPTRRVAGEQYDAYRYDSALIAEWWNFHEPDVAHSSPSGDHKSLPNDHPRPGNAGSIGAWCNARPRIRHDGLTIDRIAQDGPADQAGLQIGDDILAIDGIYLFTVEELMNRMHRYKPGTKISLRYRRRSTIYDVFVTMSGE